LADVREMRPINIVRKQTLTLENGSWQPGETVYVQVFREIQTSGSLAELHGTELKILIVLGLAASPLGIGTPEDENFYQDLLTRGIVMPCDRGKLFCYIAHDQLCKLVGVTKNTLTKHAERLVSRGLIQKRVIPHGSARYNIYFVLPASGIDKYSTYHKHSIPANPAVPKFGTAPIPKSLGNGTNLRRDGTTTTTATHVPTFDDDAVLSYFARRKGVKRYKPTGHDRKRLDQLHQAGYSEAEVIAAIDQAFDTRDPDAPPIRQFSYCAAIALKTPPLGLTETPGTPSAVVQDAPSVLKNVKRMYEQEIGPLTPLVEQELSSLIARHPDLEAWTRAFSEAARANVRKLSYIAAILNGTGCSPVPAFRRDENDRAKSQPTPSGRRSRSKRKSRGEWSTEALDAARERARGLQPLDIAAVLGIPDA